MNIFVKNFINANMIFLNKNKEMQKKLNKSKKKKHANIEQFEIIKLKGFFFF